MLLTVCFSYLRNVLCFSSGVTAMLWVPPMGSVTSALVSVSASLASPVSTVSAVRPTTLDLALKAANVRMVACSAELECPLTPANAVNTERTDSLLMLMCRKNPHSLCGHQWWLAGHVFQLQLML